MDLVPGQEENSLALFQVSIVNGTDYNDNSPWDWGHNDIKLRTMSMDCGHNDIKLGAKRVIYQKIAGMIAGIKFSFLTCKCVFHRPEHDAEF